MTVQKSTALAAAFLGLGAITLGSVATAQAPPAPPAGVGHMGNRGGRERHPEIRAALRGLMRAKAALQHGSHDFSGHREKALDLTQQAINECQQALRDDQH